MNTIKLFIQLMTTIATGILACVSTGSAIQGIQSYPASLLPQILVASAIAALITTFIHSYEVKTIEKGEADTFEVQLLTVNSNRILFEIKDVCRPDYNTFHNIYEYKNGKLVRLAKLFYLTKEQKYADLVLTDSATSELCSSFDGKKMIVKWYDQNPATGNICFRIAYTISGNTIKQVGTAQTIYYYNKSDKLSTKPKWTACRKFTAYKAAGVKTKVYTVNPGDKVTLKTMTVKNKNRWIQITNSKGKTGCFIVPANYIYQNGYFKEARFAG